jgi:hypothetical protein
MFIINTTRSLYFLNLNTTFVRGLNLFVIILGRFFVLHCKYQSHYFTNIKSDMKYISSKTGEAILPFKSQHNFRKAA